jgi:proline iminopeptidase
MYAMAYANKYPEHVKRMILSCSGGIDLNFKKYAEQNILSRLNEKEREKYKFWTSEEQIEKDPVQAKKESARLIARVYVYDPKHANEVAESLSNPQFAFPKVAALVWNDLEKTNFDLKGKFKNFSSPTLIIDGRQDFLGEEVPLLIQQNIPGSNLMLLNKSSHYPWLDGPEEYLDAITAFLKNTN